MYKLVKIKHDDLVKYSIMMDDNIAYNLRTNRIVSKIQLKHLFEFEYYNNIFTFFREYNYDYKSIKIVNFIEVVEILYESENENDFDTNKIQHIFVEYFY